MNRTGARGSPRVVVAMLGIVCAGERRGTTGVALPALERALRVRVRAQSSPVRGASIATAVIGHDHRNAVTQWESIGRALIFGAHEVVRGIKCSRRVANEGGD